MAHGWAWLRQQPETIETVVGDTEVFEPPNEEEWLKRRRQTEICENFPARPALAQERMSKGREPIWMAGWVQRLLSAFSRLDIESARVARHGCDHAGERELSWYKKPVKARNSAVVSR